MKKHTLVSIILSLFLSISCLNADYQTGAFATYSTISSSDTTEWTRYQIGGIHYSDPIVNNEALPMEVTPYYQGVGAYIVSVSRVDYDNAYDDSSDLFSADVIHYAEELNSYFHLSVAYDKRDFAITRQLFSNREYHYLDYGDAYYAKLGYDYFLAEDASFSAWGSFQRNEYDFGDQIDDLSESFDKDIITFGLSYGQIWRMDLDQWFEFQGGLSWKREEDAWDSSDSSSFFAHLTYFIQRNFSVNFGWEKVFSDKYDSSDLINLGMNYYFNESISLGAQWERTYRYYDNGYEWSSRQVSVSFAARF